MVKKSIIKIVQDYLDKVKQAGIPVNSAVVYGSFARGENTANSDIDLLVLSSIFDKEKKEQDISTLWKVTRHIDNRIEPAAVGIKEFKERQDSPIIGIARQEGIVIKISK